MEAMKRERHVGRVLTYVVYNEHLTLMVQSDGQRAFFEYQNDEGDVEWSVDYVSESAADDAYCAHDIRWVKPSVWGQVHQDTKLLFA
jgi:hypothetical protein